MGGLGVNGGEGVLELDLGRLVWVRFFYVVVFGFVVFF